MNAFEANFPELAAMRRRARRRQLGTNLILAASLLIFVLLVVGAVNGLQALVEWLNVRVAPQLPTVRPALETAISSVQALLR